MANKIKKIISFLIGLCLIFSLLVACGNVKETESKNIEISEKSQEEIDTITVSKNNVSNDINDNIEYDIDAEVSKLLKESDIEHPLKSVIRNGSSMSLVEYDYTEYYPNGEVLMEWNKDGTGLNYYYLNDNGKPALEIHRYMSTIYGDYYTDNEPVYEYFYYDDMGNLMFKYNENNNYIYATKNKYDDKGNIIKTFEAEFNYNSQYTLDELKDMLDDYLSQQSILGKYYEYIYDDNDNIISKTVKAYNDDKSLSIYGEKNYYYDENNSLTSSSSYYENNKNFNNKIDEDDGYIITATYDEYNNMQTFEITQKSKSSHGYYLLEYDKQNNLVSSQITDGNNEDSSCLSYFLSLRFPSPFYENCYYDSIGRIENSCTYEYEYY